MAKRAGQLVLMFLADPVRAKSFNVKDYHAAGDGKNDDTDYIQDTFNAAMNAGSGHIIFPKGKYRMGPIHFTGLKQSRIQFEKGAEVYMLDKKAFQKHSSEKIWIKGEYCDDLQIDGGVFHGVGTDWKKPSGKDDRPRMFQFAHMNSFEMRGADLLQAPHEHIHLNAGDGVWFHDMTFNTDVQLNSDGLTLEDTKNATVSGVHITNQDDCLKIAGECSQVRFEKCSCTGGHGLSLGGGAHILKADSITFYDIDMLGMADGARFKITPETTGHARDITWQKIRMTNVRSPIIVQTDYNADSHKNTEHFDVGDFYFTDIQADYDSSKFIGSGADHAADTGGRPSAGMFRCTNASPCNKLHLTDISIDSSAEWICEKGKGSMTNVHPKASCLSDGLMIV